MRNTLILFVLLLSFQSNAQFYKDIEFNAMENFSVSKEGDKTHIGFDYVINNPNWYNIVIKPSSLFLTIAGQDCGWVRIHEKVKLKKKTEAGYPFVLVGDSENFVKSAFSSLWALLSGNGIDFNIKGKIKAGAFLIAKKWDIDYTYKMTYEEFMSFF
ncbi:MAG: hypothetical protein MI810_22015 [Flavobacteriales bacterium]|nr:hypothetical protein [Flavobacteriales bacterium]